MLSIATELQFEDVLVQLLLLYLDFALVLFLNFSRHLLVKLMIGVGCLT